MATLTIGGKTVVTQTGTDEPVLGSGVDVDSALTGATFPAGHIVQVKHITYNTAAGYNNTQTDRVPISGFYKDITLKYSNSLIIAQAYLAIGFTTTPEWSWFIDAEISTNTDTFISSGTYEKLGVLPRFDNKMNGYHGGPRDGGASNFTTEVESYSHTVSHTPNSTNPIRYQVNFQTWWTNANYWYINRSGSDTNNGYMTRGSSSLTLYEVKQ
jgi:hypothetical protein